MFHSTLFGYDRTEVDDHLRQAELAHARLADEHDALGARCRELERRLVAAHDQNAELRERIDLLRREPVDAAALQERLRGMLDVAREEAAEHLAAARAQAAAELEQARREVAALNHQRDRLRDQLSQVGDLLDDLEAAVGEEDTSEQPPRLVAA
ncbi:DivIVA domain-containing protein [Amycolatopsis albispora]|uniref:Cell division protein DivIVA n=1 Tax=Amycolatopsis albispora TaxID=1804986 RepID=A0A344L0V4_9PSEU|nr:DivIVA domain-containing protein [Amycolatopsis albispora]AXB41678.1 hypothetical protein A4R43_03395 [Amycolatopsis albispora]